MLLHRHLPEAVFRAIAAGRIRCDPEAWSRRDMPPELSFTTSAGWTRRQTPRCRSTPLLTTSSVTDRRRPQGCAFQVPRPGSGLAPVRFPLGCHSRRPILKSPTSSFLLGIDRDHRLPYLMELLRPTSDVLEFHVSLRVLRSLSRSLRPAVRSRANPGAHASWSRDWMSLRSQLGRQLARDLDRQAQR